MGAQRVEMRGILTWSVRWTRRAGTIDFCLALAALVSQYKILFSSPHTFHFIWSLSPSTLLKNAEAENYATPAWSR
jgi:hypothetical protein